jgi:hypothetical protein
MDNFQKIRIDGGGEYWTCVQENESRNWNWKPWHHLERLCQKQGLDDFAVRGFLFERLGRKLECECQVLYKNNRQRGYGRVWDTVYNYYWMHEFNKKSM